MADITMPQLGETVTEGTILRWLKNPGENVALDEPLFEVSTDKVDTEVPSPFAGVLFGSARPRRMKPFPSAPRLAVIGGSSVDLCTGSRRRAPISTSVSARATEFAGARSGSVAAESDCSASATCAGRPPPPPPGRPKRRLHPASTARHQHNTDHRPRVPATENPRVRRDRTATATAPGCCSPIVRRLIERTTSTREPRSMVSGRG